MQPIQMSAYLVLCQSSCRLSVSPILGIPRRPRTDVVSCKTRVGLCLSDFILISKGDDAPQLAVSSGGESSMPSKSLVQLTGNISGFAKLDPIETVLRRAELCSSTSVLSYRMVPTCPARNLLTGTYNCSVPYKQDIALLTLLVSFSSINSLS